MAINLGSNFNTEPTPNPQPVIIEEPANLEALILQGNMQPTPAVQTMQPTPTAQTAIQSNHLQMQHNVQQTSSLVSKPVQETQVAEFTKTYKEKLRQMPEVEALTGQINIDDLNTILSFGQDASKGISKVSDNLLSTMKGVDVKEAGEMIEQLAKVMDKFDVAEFKEKNDQPPEEPKKKGLFGGLWNKTKTKTKETVDSLFQKYDNMGTEVDKIYVILKKYEQQIEEANKKLKTLYDANISFYKDLEMYIVAGEIGLEELDTKLIPQYEKQAIETQDNMLLQQVETLKRTRDMLDQRIYDLRLAENVALQSIPIIQGIEYSNFNLTRKINSAFIITLPIFKQCLTQAVMLKRQELQAKSLKALDDKTNELLLRNADTMVRQTTEIARMAGGSSIQLETLEKTWQTIVDGIDQVNQIEDENRRQRVENSKKLEEIKAQMLMPKQ